MSEDSLKNILNQWKVGDLLHFFTENSRTIVDLSILYEIIDNDDIKKIDTAKHVLKGQVASYLILSDFEQRYPAQSNNLNNNWAKIADSIIKTAKRKCKPQSKII
ncbi:uncharacterized protein LOC143897172 [Temnothorax americanus]|uniref:uncharacterized protein LOC143897172 n=1 Tax=Temnothorax americanus TaxID=1964332 RepID=UPI004068C93B